LSIASPIEHDEEAETRGLKFLPFTRP
jgi:hypothetical protein